MIKVKKRNMIRGVHGQAKTDFRKYFRKTYKISAKAFKSMPESMRRGAYEEFFANSGIYFTFEDSKSCLYKSNKMIVSTRTHHFIIMHSKKEIVLLNSLNFASRLYSDSFFEPKKYGVDVCND